MKINGAAPSKVINIYNNNKKVENKQQVGQKKDSLEISQAGRSLSSLSIDNNYGNSPEKIEALKKAISEGTYKANAQLTAKKMIDIAKGRDI